MPECDWCDDLEMLDDGDDGLTCPKCWPDLSWFAGLPPTPAEYVAAVQGVRAQGTGRTEFRLGEDRDA